MNKTFSLFVQHAVIVMPKIASNALVVGHPVHTLAELQQQIHDDLRRQHPEWVGPNGESPMCDFYEARLSRLLGAHQTSGPRTLEEATVG